MFAQQLNQLMAVLDVTATELSQTMECDTSNISRMCSGARVPKKGGIATVKLIQGLYRCAESRNRMPAVCTLVGCQADASPEELCTSILRWLYSDDEKQDPQTAANASPVPFRSFGDKLDAVMRLAELSNVRFGKMINLDASYISRFRSGLRSPRSNPEVVKSICTVLFNRLYAQERLERLSQMMGQPLPEDSQEAYQAFSNWLCDFSPEKRSQDIEGLLETIDTYSPEELSVPQFTDTAAPAEKPLYAGTDGLRTAVLRFLNEVLRRGGKELWLYSDLNMDWMTEDPEFLPQWSARMLACVRQGMRIRIIHNLDREHTEMFDAIHGWLPLYMSGRIRSYTLRRETYRRFAHTLFLCPGIACIEGAHPMGCDGLYRYHTDRKLIDVYVGMFETLCSGASPLVQMFSSSERPDLGGDEGITLIANELSLATMPGHVLTSALERSPLSAAERKAICEEHRNVSRSLTERLERGCYIHECLPLAADEALFGGMCRMDVAGGVLYYTPREYADHLRAILTLSETYSSYRLFPMPEAAFPNTRILVASDFVAVSRTKQPRVMFVISHSSLCEAFGVYAEHLKTQYRLDKQVLRERLEQYL